MMEKTQDKIDVVLSSFSSFACTEFFNSNLIKSVADRQTTRLFVE